MHKMILSSHKNQWYLWGGWFNQKYFLAMAFGEELCYMVRKIHARWDTIHNGWCVYISIINKSNTWLKQKFNPMTNKNSLLFVGTSSYHLAFSFGETIETSMSFLWVVFNLIYCFLFKKKKTYYIVCLDSWVNLSIFLICL